MQHAACSSTSRRDEVQTDADSAAVVAGEYNLVSSMQNLLSWEETRRMGRGRGRGRGQGYQADGA